jgi:lipopolysaccharide biosynthesis protein
MSAPRTVAFYLPQFHPVPVNDATWGPGFTEWHNVVRARPRFSGHRQPVLPAHLGFYDLRLADTRVAQAALARAHGIDAFCWYHYWFDGERLLNEPFDRMLGNPAEDLPFLLCWANEAWTKNWSGRSGEVIVPQRYSEEGDRRHARWLAAAFADPRYVALDGRPVFLVYQPNDLPDARRTCDVLREEVTRAGVPEPLLLAVNSFRTQILDPGRLGFDGVVEQQPDLNVVRPRWRAALRRALSLLGVVDRYPALTRAPYELVVREALARLDSSSGLLCPTVCPGWDNTPRRPRGGVVLEGATPEAYEVWLRETLRRTHAPLVFVNAWNEWAEGAHLEPDDVHGTSFLEAHRRAVSGAEDDAG